MRLAVIIIIISINLYVKCKPKYLFKRRSTNDNFNGHNCTTCQPHKKTDIIKCLTASSTIVAVYEGNVARMQCCYQKDNGKGAENASWAYAKVSRLQFLNHMTFTPVVQENRAVIQNGTLSIYRTATEDAGAYRWQTENDVLTSGIIILEVIDDEMYTVVKNDESTNSIQSIDQELVTFNVWSSWSECNAGRRRRFGMCCVKLHTTGNSTEYDYHVSSTTLELLKAFPHGIPCRSSHLPFEISNLPAVRNRTNKIKIITCKVQHKDEIYVVRSPTGSILETANNSAGIYSLSQLPLPPQPPPPTRSIMFVERGQRVLVKCPGTTLRDVPVTWRDGRGVAPGGGGRLYVNSRDQVVIRSVLYEDTNLYVCWEGDNAAGYVQLVVWGGRGKWNHHTLLAAMAIVGALLLHISVKLL